MSQQPLALEVQLEHREWWRGAFEFCSSACGWKSSLGASGLEREQCLYPVIADRVLAKNTVTTTHDWQVPVAGMNSSPLLLGSKEPMSTVLG